jgi:hypothetical protein
MYDFRAIESIRRQTGGWEMLQIFYHLNDVVSTGVWVPAND